MLPTQWFSKQQGLLALLKTLYLISSQRQKVITMTTLTASKRNKLPKSKFALPSERKYPINDNAQAISAKARAEQLEHKGKISSATQSRTDSKANKVLKNPTKGR